MWLPPESETDELPLVFVLSSPPGATRPHAHHGMHLLMARAGELRVEVDGASHEVAGVLTPPGVTHSVDASHLDELVTVFVEPECELGARLVVALAGRARVLSRDEVDEALATLPDDEDVSGRLKWAERVLDALVRVEGAPRPVRHPRVGRLLRLLEDEPLRPAPSFDALAARVGLSPSRLRHAFKESVGTPFRVYVRWLRLRRATLSLARGDALAQAAIEGGFADQAHMTRTFAEMFGISPGELVRLVRGVSESE